MTKKLAVLTVMFLAFGLGWAQTSEEQKTAINWEEVQVVYDLNEVADMTQGSKMTETIKTSLNFGTKSKVKKNCLKELKKQAAEQGYSVIYIDEEASQDKRFNKRGIEVTLVGIGYKG
ncbi:hypothetical protein [Lutimonas zeaxanthinifaciens]|uniref:hypothetical protein n=1 Tax=Lutimonas zeaxanthinifaciens TaxID=3060215 RepID=UPI00265CE38C|nr:hypothetical protein [Lutimonas sp. YSD2104]WKK66473.1 hypothetical protein QZH61_02360 [Lutimonas sp. YSD2104]